MEPHRWWRRAGTVLASVAVLAGALGVSATASATPVATSGARIDGGVEDGMFSLSCLKTGATSPDTSVLGAASYRDPLGRVVRILVPYDIAVNPGLVDQWQCFQQYLLDAKADGVAVEVALNRDGASPALATYTTAVTGLASSGIAGDISYLSAWNEPNNPAYLDLPAPTAAQLAGQYFQAARQAFASHHVTLIAGDFASGVGRSFFDLYVDNLGGPWPKVWGIHPYTDITNFEYYMWSGKTSTEAANDAAAISKVRQLATFLRGRPAGTRIWINEIFVEHKADRCPPAGVSVSGVTPATCQADNNDPTIQSRLPKFSIRAQDEAARFFDGQLPVSLPSYNRQQGLPPVTRFVYLRVWSFSTNVQRPNADVLEIHFLTDIYCTLSGTCTP